MSNCKIYADKIYADSDLNNRLQANQNSIILTPAKKEKGQKILDAADDIYSYLVSKVRQPIESLFTGLLKKLKFSLHKGLEVKKDCLCTFGGIGSAIILIN